MSHALPPSTYAVLGLVDKVPGSSGSARCVNR